jgi:hypothetical protein
MRQQPIDRATLVHFTTLRSRQSLLVLSAYPKIFLHMLPILCYGMLESQELFRHEAVEANGE